jgi:archaellum component FlaC
MTLQITLLEKAKENAARFKKAKCMHLWLTSKIGIQEKMLADAQKFARDYAESADRLSKSLEANKKEYERIGNFIVSNESAIEDSDKAEEIAKRIEKLTKQLEDLKNRLTV